ncbi:uncharacterized protein BDV17DRAFT_101663 [Aspergillus undulatus]|uniref:uncharacterized protein n=1 Tax=Aspergillus undulatus TaxID=1810928 RepID=UPI003CCCD120
MWIGKRYKNSVYNPPDGSRWKVIKKLSERVVLSDSYQYEMGRDTSEVHAVYRVRQTHGKSVGKKAILKVSMQIPEDGGKDVSLDHSVRAREASDIYGIATMRETHALTWLTERNCSVSPRLLSLVVGKQEGSTMPVPGGWIVFILMDMVPGVNLEEFRYFDFAKRERIRQAFLKSMT